MLIAHSRPPHRSFLPPSSKCNAEIRRVTIDGLVIDQPYMHHTNAGKTGKDGMARRADGRRKCLICICPRIDWASITAPTGTRKPKSPETTHQLPLCAKAAARPPRYCIPRICRVDGRHAGFGVRQVSEQVSENLHHLARLSGEISSLTPRQCYRYLCPGTGKSLAVWRRVSLAGPHRVSSCCADLHATPMQQHPTK